MFGIKKDNQADGSSSSRLPEFSYLDDGAIYMDTACQTLRPKPVMDALQKYYTEYNACGGRVKYAWGQRVDEEIESVRHTILELLSASDKEYSASFTLNTTYGLNLVLEQIPSGKYSRIITSDIEHNSVFISTMTASKRLGIERVVLERAVDGTLLYQPAQLTNAVVVLNSVSNIDGRSLGNIRQIVEDTHNQGGIVIVDAAQTMAHHSEMLKGVPADAICFSAHKMYAPSMGVIVAKNDLITSLESRFVGGGMVSSVSENSFELLPDDLASRFEPGLQDFGGIIALGEALKWLKELKPFGKSREDYLHSLTNKLYQGLSDIDSLEMMNETESPVISVYSPETDAHRLALFLSSAGIMVRSGYFCCHYYLKEKKVLPPLLRFSLGLHNTEADVDKTLETMHKLIRKA